MEEHHGQQVIEYVTTQSCNAASLSNQFRYSHRKLKATLRQPRPVSKGDARLWHLHIGHPGPMSLHHIGTNTVGVKLQGPKTTQCQQCAQAKIKRQISRALPNRISAKPLSELHIDWTDLEEAHAGFVRVMFIHDAFSGKTFPYFMTSHGGEKETL